MQPENQYIAFKTILVREVKRFMRIWIQTVVPAVIVSALYFIIFGKVLGDIIKDIDGINYIDYIIPGVILMTVIQNSYSNVVSSFYSAKYHRSVEELLVSPTPNYIILLGFAMGGLVRGLVVGFAVTLVSLVFTNLHIHNVWIVLAVVVLTSVLFSLAGFINAVFANSFDDISIVPTFVLTPLIYLGGVFYHLSALSEFWQNVAVFNPVLYMINAFRYGFLQSSDVSIVMSFAIISGFIVIFFSVAMFLLNKGIGLKS